MAISNRVYNLPEILVPRLIAYIRLLNAKEIAYTYIKSAFTIMVMFRKGGPLSINDHFSLMMHCSL